MSLLSEQVNARAADQAFADAETPTTALFMELLADACRRVAPMRQVLPMARIKQMIAARAWTDAALALVALAAPQWQMRRLAYDDGEWHCALSRQRDMPDWLDQTVEAHHQSMPLAILCALAEATTGSAPSHLATVSASHGPGDGFEPMLCDNFG